MPALHKPQTADADLGAALRAQGLHVTFINTGGGCHVHEIPIDQTARDTYRVIWVSDEGFASPEEIAANPDADAYAPYRNADAGFIIGWYDFKADPESEGTCSEFHPSHFPGAPSRYEQVAKHVRDALEVIWIAGDGFGGSV